MPTDLTPPGRGLSPRTVALIVFALASEGAGILTGHWFFRIYEQTVPGAILTAFNKGAAYTWFLTNGAILGALYFLWGLTAATIGIWLGRKKGERG